MAISRPTSEPEISEETLTGPGKQLRESRIARNLSVEDVAARLRLHRKTIQKIEADDYEGLPAPTFVRGYLRGYARLLDMSPEKIITAYNTLEFEPPPLVRDISNTEEVRSTDFSFRLATYLILTIVVVLVAIWWQNQETGVPRPNAADSLASESLVTVPEEEPILATLPDTGPSVPAAAPLDAGTPFVEFPASAAENAGDETAADTAVEETAGNTLESTLGTAPETTGASGAAVEQAAGNEVMLAEAETTPPAAATDPSVPVPQQAPSQTGTVARVSTLRIALGAKSWVEVIDGNERRLYYDLAEAGETIVVREPPPLRVLLGNTSDVAVEFNGRPFDISPFTNEGVARFELTAPSAESTELQSVSQASEQQ